MPLKESRSYNVLVALARQYGIRPGTVLKQKKEGGRFYDKNDEVSFDHIFVTSEHPGIFLVKEI